MTAEIALLNKSAVALAADSAATVSSGTRQEKVFNSEDKLFELSNVQPIGVMIYNSTTFMGTPVHILIKNFRAENRYFRNVEEAAVKFRNYLRDFGSSLPQEVKESHFARLTEYPMKLVESRVSKKMQERVKKLIEADKGKPKRRMGTLKRVDFPADDAFDESIDFHKKVFEKAGSAQTTGEKPIPQGIFRTVKTAAKQDKLSGKIAELIEVFLKSGASSSSSTGFVVAGFGEDEIFPSLRSFEIDGMLGNELRFMNCADHDITLQGPSAKVLPFAQQDMVDRFVSGIDESSQLEIERFCRERLNMLHSELIDVLGVEDPDERKQLSLLLEKANKEYIRGLQEDGFEPIKERSRTEMEGMVEFMPKSELAQMAESLVELTSIKRRVSRGFETVGGPIDVAVISRSDGFVWIKRKHYFPPELNTRFFERVHNSVTRGGWSDGYDHEASPPGEPRRGTVARDSRDRAREEATAEGDVAESARSSRPVRGSRKKEIQNQSKA